MNTMIPWGYTRVQERLPVGSPLLSTPTLDPVTQTAMYVDEAGQPIEAGAHGTNKTKGTASMSGGGDGNSPPPQKQDDTTTDYESD
jgi:putative ATP-grasp target RiPP